MGDWKNRNKLADRKADFKIFDSPIILLQAMELDLRNKSRRRKVRNGRGGMPKKLSSIVDKSIFGISVHDYPYNC